MRLDVKKGLVYEKKKKKKNVCFLFVFLTALFENIIIFRTAAEVVGGQRVPRRLRAEQTTVTATTACRNNNTSPPPAGRSISAYNHRASSNRHAHTSDNIRILFYGKTILIIFIIFFFLYTNLQITHTHTRDTMAAGTHLVGVVEHNKEGKTNKQIQLICYCEIIHHDDDGDGGRDSGLSTTIDAATD